MIDQRLNIWNVKVIGLFALALTSACSSSNPDPVNFATTQDASDAIDGLFSDVLKSGFVETTPSQLPTAGSVVYEGYLQVNTSEPTLAPADDFLYAVGQVALTANFSGAGTIDGVADHFIDGNDQQMTGAMTITTDSIGSAGGFTAQVDGTITNVDGFDYTYTVPMSNGSFLGPNADYVAASGFGNFTNRDTTVVTPFDMIFAAQR